MIIKSYAYPHDPNGTAASNRIVGERHTISPANGQDYTWFIPKATPYFRSSLIVRHVASGRTLTEGVDYVPTHRFDAASNTAPYLSIYASVTVLDTSLTGTFEIDYQTLGGEFTLDESSLLFIMANAQLDPRATRWDAIVNPPTTFDPVAHLHHMTQSVGYDELVAEVRRLVDAFTLESSRLSQRIRAHIDDKNNPHETNLLKLGIERFENVYKATVEQLDAGVDDINYVTIAILKEAVNRLQAAIGSGHVSDTNNPHQVTADQVGLGRVPNWSKATDVQINNASANAFIDPQQVAQMIATRIAELPLSQVNQILLMIQEHVNDKDNPHEVTTSQLGIPKANEQVGSEGDVPFYIDDSQPFNTVAGTVLNKVGVVHNATELTAQLAFRESFADVFNTWRRIAWGGANNPLHLPDELTGWSYNPALDRVNSTINSTSTIALIDPERTSGDFVFEVTLGSNNSDDDRIGISLGPILVNGVYQYLTVFRQIDGPRLFTVVLNFGTSNSWVIHQTNQDLMWPDGVINNSRINNSDGPGNFYGGWSNYQALGDIPLKVERIGNQLIVSTGNPGQLTYVPAATATINLDSDPRLVPFKGPVTLGYVSQSQANSYWTTLRRTGANAPIAALHTQQVHEWDGTAYTLSTKTMAEVLRRGRYYLNPMTKRLYWAPGSGSAIVIAGDSVQKDLTSASAVLDRIVHVTNASTAAVGEYVDYYNQNIATGAMTYRGRIEKVTVNGTNIRGGTGATDHRLILGNPTALFGGLRATQAGEVGLAAANGNWLVYVDTSGILQHTGLNRMSDAEVKESPIELDMDIPTSTLLKLYQWTWANDARVPEHLRGTMDSGVIAQEVQKYFPNCVSRNSVTGLLSVDDGKLALHLSLLILKRLDNLK